MIWTEQADGRQDADSAIAILDIGGMNLQADQVALGVGDNVALAAPDLFARIEPAWAAGRDSRYVETRRRSSRSLPDRHLYFLRGGVHRRPSATANVRNVFDF